MDEDIDLIAEIIKIDADSIKTNDEKKNMISDIVESDILTFIDLKERIDEMLHVMIIIKKYSIDVNTEMWFHFFGVMIYYYDYSREKIMKILEILFSLGGIDYGLINWEVPDRSPRFALNPIQTLPIYIRDRCPLLKCLFSNPNIVVADPRPETYTVGIRTSLFNTLAYDENFNRVFDDLILSGIPEITTCSFKKLICLGINIFESLDGDVADYFRGKQLHEFNNPVQLLKKTLEFFLFVTDHSLEQQGEQFEINFDKASDIHEHTDGIIIDYDCFSSLCSISYVCVNNLNFTCLMYLIASGKDPELFFRSKKNSCAGNIARNSIEHYFKICDDILEHEDSNPTKLKELVDIKNIMLLYMRNPQKAITKAKKFLIPGREASEIFISFIMVADGFFMINDSHDVTRFFGIFRRLPAELQMILSHRVIGSPHDFIDPKHSNETAKKIIC